MPFDQKAASLVFGSGRSCLFLFTAKEGDEHDAATAALTEASEDLKAAGILMSTSGITGGLD